MANALNIWDEETKQYIGLPILKGEKGDKGENYVLTQADKEEIAAIVKGEMLSSST